MRLLICLTGIVATLTAQVPDWRSRILALPENPAATVSIQDLQQFEATARYAAPYLTSPAAANFEANREVVRRLWTYLAAVEVIARNPGINRGLGPAVGRARNTLTGLGLAYPYWLTSGYNPSSVATPAASPAVPVKRNQPPFTVEAPELNNVPAAEQKEADELTGRYESAASRAAATWQSADVLRQSLAARSMTLNPRITESIVRLQLFLELAAGDMRRGQWKSARENLERTEYLTTQVTNSVGR